MVNGLYKTVISQLTKQRGVQVNVMDVERYITSSNLLTSIHSKLSLIRVHVV